MFPGKWFQQKKSTDNSNEFGGRRRLIIRAKLALRVLKARIDRLLVIQFIFYEVPVVQIPIRKIDE
jgi:hypothetical protein